MYESDQQRQENINTTQKEILLQLNLKPENLLKVFVNKDTLRLNRYGFDLLKNSKNFKQIKFCSGGFRLQDLIKISKSNNSLHFIDLKNVVIYTLDNEFVNYCNLIEYKLDSLRLSI